MVSALGVLAMLALLAYCCNATSFWRVAAVYGGPYLGLNAWLGIVTKLHHTDVDVPHLEGEEWNFSAPGNKSRHNRGKRHKACGGMKERKSKREREREREQQQSRERDERER